MKKLLCAIFLLLTLNVFALARDFESDGDVFKIYNQGLQYYKNGAYMSAASCFKEIITIDSDFYDAYYYLALAYESLNNISGTEAVLQQLLLKNSNYFSANYKLAEIYYNKKQYNEALRYLNLIPEYADESIKAKKFTLLINATLAEQNPALKKELLAKPLPEYEKITDIITPTGITADSSGDIYIASYKDNAIFKINKYGKAEIYVKNSLIEGPIGLIADKKDNLYVANYNRNNILKIDKTGNVTVFVKYSNKPYYLFIKNDKLYISEQGSDLVIIRTLY